MEKLCCPNCGAAFGESNFRQASGGDYTCRECGYVATVTDLRVLYDMELSTLERHLRGALYSLWRLRGERHRIT